jgi:hypothetical protein
MLMGGCSLCVPVFDHLINEKRYLAAVTRLDRAIDAMFRCGPSSRLLHFKGLA